MTYRCRNMMGQLVGLGCRVRAGGPGGLVTAEEVKAPGETKDVRGLRSRDGRSALIGGWWAIGQLHRERGADAWARSGREQPQCNRGAPERET